MSLLQFLVLMGLVLIVAGVSSLIMGKTIGLYGVVETKNSIFYWIIVITYLGLGGLCWFNAVSLWLSK